MNIDDFKIITPIQQLVLRPHRDEDAAFMVELNSDPDVTAHTPDGPLPGPEIAKEIIQSLRQQFLEKKIGRFIVEEPKTKRVIGWCGLKWLEETDEIDLGYRFLKETWGKGIATEAALSCLDYGFNQLNFNRITAKVLPQNVGSIKVLLKLGMKDIGKVVEDDETYLYYEITKNDFINNNKKINL